MEQYNDNHPSKWCTGKTKWEVKGGGAEVLVRREIYVPILEYTRPYILDLY